MPSPSYTFSEFLDRLLLRLYELDRNAENPSHFFNLSEIAGELRDRPPEKWVFDAANVLRTMGWATVEINSMAVSAMISGNGRLYVEQGRGKINDIQRNRSNIYNLSVTGDHNQ